MKLGKYTLQNSTVAENFFKDWEARCQWITTSSDLHITIDGPVKIEF